MLQLQAGMEFSMKTVAVPECFRRNRKMCGEFLARVKEQTQADHIIWIAGGSFLENGFPAPNDIRADGELLKDMGADLVLSLPETAVLDREGTATFAEAALISKLRCIDSIASFPHNLRIFLLEQEVDQVHYQDRIRQASSDTSNQ